MATNTANLQDASTSITTGMESIVIVDNFQSIRGGRTLDTAAFATANPLVLSLMAGHVIINETATGNYKPMPITGTGGVETFGAITPGSAYTNGTYSDVALTGGTGTGARATIVVAGGVVTTVTKTANGSGYTVGNSLSATAASIGGTGTGFAVAVATVSAAPTSFGTLPAGHTYAGILINTISVAKPFAGILVRGTVNNLAMPYVATTILAALKAALILIDFRTDAQ